MEGIVSGVIAGLVTGAAASGWAMATWFGETSDTIQAVVTVALLVVMLTLGFRLFGNHPRVMPSIVPDVAVDVAGMRVSLNTIIALLLTVALATAVTVVLRHTQIGIRLEALAEHRRGVSLLGISPTALALGVWAVLGACSTLALLFIAPTRNPTFGALAMVIVPALAAGLIGALSNVWLAALGGLLLGALEGIGAQIPLVSDYRGAIPFLIIIVSLVWLRRKDVWDEVR